MNVYHLNQNSGSRNDSQFIITQQLKIKTGFINKKVENDVYLSFFCPNHQLNNFYADKKQEIPNYVAKSFDQNKGSHCELCAII
jgi:hypothetical protein